MRNIREFFIVRSWSEDALFPRGQGLNGIGRDLRLRGGRCRDRTQQQQQDWPELRSVHLIPSYNGVARLPGPRAPASTPAKPAIGMPAAARYDIDLAAKTAQDAWRV